MGNTRRAAVDWSYAGPALLAAYTPDDPRFTPQDLEGRDLSVRAVVSLYGPTDLRACYNHLDQTRLIGLPKVEIGQPGAATMEKNYGMQDG